MAQTEHHNDTLIVDHRAVHSRWAMENPADGAQAARAQLESLVQLCEDAGCALRIPRGRDPINEFTENAELLYGLYWFDMFLKEGLGNSGPLSVRERTHLLEQYHGRFAANHELVFFLSNQVRFTKSCGFIDYVASTSLLCIRRVEGDHRYFDESHQSIRPCRYNAMATPRLSLGV